VTAVDVAAQFALEGTLQHPALITRVGEIEVFSVRWPVLDQVWAEGLLVLPARVRGGVVALPDADLTPEQLVGWDATPTPVEMSGYSRLIWDLAAQGCAIAIPALISRDVQLSGHPRVGFTNQSHREFLYRQAFVVGRHPLGFELQQTRSALDLLQRLIGQRRPDGAEAATEAGTENKTAALGVIGWGEGARVALLTAACDERVRSTLASGSFAPREATWTEPIDRNVWRLLTEFGDAELLLLASPRSVVIEACQGPHWRSGTVRDRRPAAAPGELRTAALPLVEGEWERASQMRKQIPGASLPPLIVSGPAGDGAPGSEAARGAFLAAMSLPREQVVEGWPVAPPDAPSAPERGPAARQRRLFTGFQNHLQRLLVASHQVRDSLWRPTPATVAEWQTRQVALRERVHRELIGRLELPVTPPAPRSRRLGASEDHVAYEVLLTVAPDVIAGGILLIPKSLGPGERRPVVVCQHGLEGLASDPFSHDEAAFKYYQAFAERLVQRGYLVYCPQNPYRGEQSFRVLQRMLNPLGLSLFSVINEQHRQTLDWLKSVPWVDPERIAFYGLSYGGKTAVRVPPFLPQYALSICSGDFTDWVRTVAAHDETFSYLFTSEYEVFEWNAAHLASHAELALLMAPRPFMVEEGHRDGGQPSEWVAGEFGKVRRFYDQLGISDRAELEFFDGPHQIHGVGTFRFLEKHLRWPPPAGK
jgi:dienelactone hydrolase